LSSEFVEDLNVLRHCVDGLVDVVDSLVMLIGIDVCWNRVCEVGGNVHRRILTEKALEEFLDEVPAKSRHQAWTVVDFDQDAFEVLVLAHRDAADFDKEVSKLEPWSFGFNLE
jgi:hypothetical protein